MTTKGPEPTTETTSGKRILVASTGTALSIGLGALSQMVTFLLLGVTSRADGYAAGLALPVFVLSAVTGPLATRMAPNYWRSVSSLGMSDARRIALRSARRAAQVMMAVALLGAVCSSMTTSALYGSLSLDARQDAIQVQLLLWGSLPIAAWATIAAAYLQANLRFGVSAIIGGLPSIGVILGGVVAWNTDEVPVALSLGRGLGYLAAAAVLWALLRNHHQATADNPQKFANSIGRSAQGSTELLLLVFANSASLFLPIMERWFASSMPAGSIATVFYASQLVAITGTLATKGLSTVSGVEFSVLASRNTLRRALVVKRSILAVSLAVAAASIVGVSLLALYLFWTSRQDELHAVLMVYAVYAWVAVPSAAGSVIMTAVYAQRKFHVAAGVSLVAIALYLLAGLTFQPSTPTGLAYLALLFWAPPIPFLFWYEGRKMLD